MWGAMLRLAALRFGIAPADFWRLSLTEWRALTAEPDPDALGRARLTDLLALYPDEAPHERL